MTSIAEIFEIPERVHQGDFVLRLTEGVNRPDETLRNYVVTPQLVVCFEQALSLIRSAVESDSSKGAYLHGSFGSGKSHFMAVLTLLLQRNPAARSIPELADVVARNNAWTERRRFLVVPYHMIGATSMESAILGHYADYVRRVHPQAPTPGFYRAETLFEDARRIRRNMGDEAFFKQLGAGDDADEGWGSLGAGWDAASFESALDATPGSEDRTRLVGDLIDAFFESARGVAADGREGFVSLDEGLAVMSRHAQGLGYDALVLFLDELILWLASHAADLEFVNREGQKVAKLVEAMTAERPIPIVSFVARQRDLRELVGEHIPGAEQLGFADVLNWWEARFDEITLEDRNLPAIVEKRLLRPRSGAAARALDEAFERTASVREEVMATLLTREGDRGMFRQVYPFSPALVETLVAVSSLLQRERTALKLMLQLLVDNRDVMTLGDIVPVGDLFDVISEGDEPFTQAMRARFDDARKLYRQKLLPMLEDELGVTQEDIDSGAIADESLVKRFRNDDRLLKTLLLSALAEGVEVLRGLTPARLAALNHGSVRSPIPGQESQMVLVKCRQWAGRVGEIKVSDDGANPVVSLQIVGVDTEGVLENARLLDNYGNRVQKVKHILYETLHIPTAEGDLLPPRYDMVWRGSKRSCELLFRNIRELPLDNLKSLDHIWRFVIDFPFDQPGYSPRDDVARVQEFQASGDATDTLVWIPSFLTPKAVEDLGRLVLLDQVLAGNRLNEFGGHLSQTERDQARILLVNQRDQMRQRVRNHLMAAYGISRIDEKAIDTSHDLDEHFLSLNPHLKLQPPVGAGFKDCLEHLFAQALEAQYPDHPRFEGEVKRAGLRRVLNVVQRAAQTRDGRVEVEKPHREEVRHIAVPLRLGDMGETHFVLRDEWKREFLQKKAQDGVKELTVRRLRQWIERPERRGLARDIQNLIILGFALQTARSFYLHGGPADPQLETLDDAMELREQRLPGEARWTEAVERAGAILGVAVSPLLNAQNVARLVDEVARVARDCRSEVDRLRGELQTRLRAIGNPVARADRLRTVEASSALLSGIQASEGDAVIDALAAATIETSGTAMGEVVKKARLMADALQNAQWVLFEKIGALGEPYQERAGTLTSLVTNALTHDEHVSSLASTLKQAQSEAISLLGEAATAAHPPAKPEPSPEAARPGRKLAKQGRKTVQASAAREVFAEIEADLAGRTDATLEIDWKVYRAE
ncbi:MAG: phage resistance protein [Gammaproteobacteria bacterium]|nr:phage resistance protein [Gammaproteobacteria bacterium]